MHRKSSQIAPETLIILAQEANANVTMSSILYVTVIVDAPLKMVDLLRYEFIFANKMTNWGRTFNSITNCLMLPVEILRTLITKWTKCSPNISTWFFNQNIYSEKNSLFYKAITCELVDLF